MTSPPTLESRLARVEQVITALSREVAAIRAELGARRRRPCRSNRGRPLRRSLGPRRCLVARRDRCDSLDFERLLGRYGMLGIAVFAAVAAVGTFLSWAISHGYLVLGPAARVALGLAFAAGIGAWGAADFGARSDRSGRASSDSRSSSCSFARTPPGPSFSLVPTWFAFVGAASDRVGTRDLCAESRTTSRSGASRSAARRSRHS